MPSPGCGTPRADRGRPGRGETAPPPARTVPAVNRPVPCSRAPRRAGRSRGFSGRAAPNPEPLRDGRAATTGCCSSPERRAAGCSAAALAGRRLRRGRSGCEFGMSGPEARSSSALAAAGSGLGGSLVRRPRRIRRQDTSAPIGSSCRPAPAVRRSSRSPATRRRRRGAGRKQDDGHLWELASYEAGLKFGEAVPALTDLWASWPVQLRQPFHEPRLARVPLTERANVTRKGLCLAVFPGQRLQIEEQAYGLFIAVGVTF